MDAVRCLHCGETRWMLFRAVPGRRHDGPCAACGGPVVVERRRPGSSPRMPIVERRDHPVTRPPSRLAGT